MGSRVRVPYTPQHSNIGTLTEWLGSGLQNRVQQFESAGYLNREQAITLFALFRFICHHHLKAQSNPKVQELTTSTKESGFANHHHYVIVKAALRF
jgi:hypothetical protein